MLEGKYCLLIIAHPFPEIKTEFLGKLWKVEKLFRTFGFESGSVSVFREYFQHRCCWSGSRFSSKSWFSVAKSFYWVSVQFHLLLLLLEQNLYRAKYCCTPLRSQWNPLLPFNILSMEFKRWYRWRWFCLDLWTVSDQNFVTKSSKYKASLQEPKDLYNQPVKNGSNHSEVNYKVESLVIIGILVSEEGMPDFGEDCEIIGWNFTISILWHDLFATCQKPQKLGPFYQLPENLKS